MPDQFIMQYRPWFDENERKALNDYMLSDGFLTEFKRTQEFGDMIGAFTKSTYSTILMNGTITMTAALYAMEISRDDEVIVPAYTMIATPNSVIMANATPVFADVERDTMCLDFESMKSKVTDKTKAIILVSINGRYPKGLDQILAYCKENNIRIIEDAAQSLGCFHNGKHVGTFGDIGSFSFSMPKIITTGQGGAIVTEDEALFDKIKLVKNFGRKQAGIDDHVFFGVNFKFTDLQAVIGIEQMKKLDTRIELKKRNYRILRDGLSDIVDIEFFETSDEIAPWFNDILVPDPNALKDYLKAAKIGSRNFYPALHTQAPYHQHNKSFPNAEHVAKHGLWLPSYPQLTEEELSYIVKTVRAYFG